MILQPLFPMLDQLIDGGSFVLEKIGLDLHTAALTVTGSYDVLNLALEGPKNLLSEANSDDPVEVSVAGATPEQDRLNSDESSLISRQPGDLSATSRIPNNE